MYSFKKSLILFCKFYFITFMSLGITWFMTKAPMLQNSFKLNVWSFIIASVIGIVAFFLYRHDKDENRKLENKDKAEAVFFTPFTIILLGIIFLHLNGNMITKDRVTVTENSKIQKTINN